MDKKEDMKELLKREDAKERVVNCAFELFSKGVDDEKIREELVVIAPNIDIDHIQRLRRRWEKKEDADKEMNGGNEEVVGGEESVQVGGIPSSGQKIKPSVIPPVIEKKVEERVGDLISAEKTEEERETPLPSQKDFVDYLRPKTEGFEGTLDEAFGKTKWRHWVRYDEGGFGFPSVEDWIELKRVLNLDDTFDLSLTEQKSVFDELKLTEGGIEEKIIGRDTKKKLEEETPYEKAMLDLEERKADIEGTELKKAPIPSPSLRDDIQKEMVRDDKVHAENVRATDELRRAITKELHAQEAYEDAKRKISRTEESIKGKMDHILSRLDKFDRSVDMLEMMDRLQKREPLEDAKLESETEMGRQFEENLSNYVSKKECKDIIDEVIGNRDMVEGKSPVKEPKKTVETPDARNGRVDDIVKDLYRNNMISIEKLAGYLGMSVEEAYRLGIEKKNETLEVVGEKLVGEVKIISDDTVVKVADALNVTVDDARRLIAEKQMERKIDEKLNEEPVTTSDKGKPEANKTDERFREQSEPEKFYNKVMRYLDIHPYLVVKKEGNKPEVYKLRLKLVGFLYGIGIGAPGGCLLLYTLLSIAGAL